MISFKHTGNGSQGAGEVGWRALGIVAFPMQNPFVGHRSSIADGDGAHLRRMLRWL